MRSTAAILCAALMLSACTAVYSTPPPRTASEQLLASTAADRAAERLAKALPDNIGVYLDRSALSGADAQYAGAAIEDQLLRRGLHVVEKPDDADAVITVRSGALSTDEDTTLVGLPQFVVPFLPSGNALTLPEVDLFKETRKRGVAQFAATGYDRKTGQLLVSIDPQYGFSHKTTWVIFFLFTLERDDLMSDEAKTEENLDRSKWRAAGATRYLPIPLHTEKPAKKKRS